MYIAVFRMCHHMLRYIHQLVSFQNFLTIRRAMWSKENILGYYRIEIRERSVAVFQCLTVRDIFVGQ